MTALDPLRILRAATHWASGISKEFGDIATAAAPTLAPFQAIGGAVTLRGHIATSLPVSICLAHGPTGREVQLLMTEQICHEGFAAIRTTEINLTLPRYLARQITALEPAA